MITISKIIMNKFLTSFLLGSLILGGCTEKQPEDKEISVLQFNIWQEGTVIPGGFDAIADEIARLKPDFAESHDRPEWRPTISPRLRHRFPGFLCG